MALSKRLRYEILRRDNHACRYCGAAAPDVKITVDHVIPTALGGTNEATNLVAACTDCNAGKASTNPESDLVGDVNDDALRWANAMKRASELERTAREGKERVADIFLEAWSKDAFMGRHPALPEDWYITLYRFLDLGLDESDLIDAARLSLATVRVHRDGKFSYFCGIVYRTLERRTAAARALIDTEDPT